jgi:hypothetical protein
MYYLSVICSHNSRLGASLRTTHCKHYAIGLLLLLQWALLLQQTMQVEESAPSVRVQLQEARSALRNISISDERYQQLKRVRVRHCGRSRTIGHSLQTAAPDAFALSSNFHPGCWRTAIWDENCKHLLLCTHQDTSRNVTSRKTTTPRCYAMMY